MTVYVGPDVHRKRTQVAVLDEEGGELLNRNVSNDPAEMTAILGSFDEGTAVAFEAAYGWGWLRHSEFAATTQAGLRHMPSVGIGSIDRRPRHFSVQRFSL